MLCLWACGTHSMILPYIARSPISGCLARQLRLKCSGNADVRTNVCLIIAVHLRARGKTSISRLEQSRTVLANLPLARVAAALVELRPEGGNDNVDCCDEPFALAVIVFFAGAFLAVDWLGEAYQSRSVQHEKERESP